MEQTNLFTGFTYQVISTPKNKVDVRVPFSYKQNRVIRVFSFGKRTNFNNGDYINKAKEKIDRFAALANGGKKLTGEIKRMEESLKGK